MRLRRAPNVWSNAVLAERRFDLQTSESAEPGSAPLSLYLSIEAAIFYRAKKLLSVIVIEYLRYQLDRLDLTRVC